MLRFKQRQKGVFFDGLYLEVLFQTSKVETDSLLVVVSILLNFQSRVTENGGMVTPCRGGEVYGLGVRVKASEESTTNAEGTSARDGLRNSNLSGNFLSGAATTRKFKFSIPHCPSEVRYPHHRREEQRAG